MIVTAWNNGYHNRDGEGYGLRVRTVDRNKFFERTWKYVLLELEGYWKVIKVKITPSFWKKCSELRSPKIGLWLNKKGLGTWPKGKPPKFSMEPKSSKVFHVCLLKNVDA
jgi:hypothetical protein